MDFKYDGPGFGKGGTVILSVDGKPVGQGPVERTLGSSIRWTPASASARRSQVR
jgi:hypothetical protein